MKDPIGRKARVTYSKRPKFTKLKECKCFQEAHQQIVDGWPLSEVARYIQEDAGEYTDIKRESLTRLLYRYKESIPVVELSCRRVPRMAIEAKKQLEASINGIKELEFLYRKELNRVYIGNEQEKRIGLLHRNTSKAIMNARKILVSIIDKKIETGIFGDKRRLR